MSAPSLEQITCLTHRACGSRCRETCVQYTPALRTTKRKRQNGGAAWLPRFAWFCIKSCHVKGDCKQKRVRSWRRDLRVKPNLLRLAMLLGTVAMRAVMRIFGALVMASRMM